MECPNPKVRFELYQRYKCIDGHMAYKAKWGWFNDWYAENELWKKENRNKLKSLYRNIDLIPCGQCIPCRMKKSTNWACRCMLEKKFGWNKSEYPEFTCWFLTFTYDDCHLRTHKTVNMETGEVHESISVRKKDLQLFFKKYRKDNPNIKIKYLDCTEYGTKTERPHCHAIVFGMPLNPNEFERHGNNEVGDPLYTTHQLDKYWAEPRNKTKEETVPLGGVQVGEVTFRSCAYVARYALKKATDQIDDAYYLAQGKELEKICMSQKIGMDYYYMARDKIYQTETVPVLDNNGNLCKPPMEYDRLFAKECPDKWLEIKWKRIANMEVKERVIRKSTDSSAEQRRQEAIKRMNKVIKDLRG